MKNISRHSGAGRNPVTSVFRKVDKTGMLSRNAGNYLIGWIPACAGTTKKRVAA
jgi:hypothetical protein